MNELRAKLNRETAKISWLELQRHYAAGNVLAVAEGADLIAVAEAFHSDSAAQVKQWLSDGTVAPVDDAAATRWVDQAAEHWAVVVAPFVLVQPTAPAVAG